MTLYQLYSVDDRAISERERAWKVAVVAYSEYYTIICLERLKKTTKNLSLESLSSDRVLNPGPPEYEVGVLTSFGIFIIIM